MWIMSMGMNRWETIVRNLLGTCSSETVCEKSHPPDEEESASLWSLFVWVFWKSKLLMTC